MIAPKTVTLNTGAKIPMLGIGTFLGKSLKKETIGELLKTAILNCGYRLIDTAKIYEYEEELGVALKEIFATGKVKREDLFIVNKLWNDEHDKVEEALTGSLKKMQLDYFDLYLVHWPVTDCLDQDKLSFTKVPLYKTWAKMEECYKKGLTKAIGVSNFNTQILLDMMTYAEIRPAINQIELHPYLPQPNLVHFCQTLGIQVMAYGPLSAPGSTAPGTSAIVDPVVLELSKKYSKSPAQICLAWGMARGHIVIPATSSASRLKENMDAVTFTMEKEDVEKMSELKTKLRIYDPLTGVFHPWGHIPVFE